MKLISMTDFVLEHSQNAPLEEYHQVNETFVNKVINYAMLLKQPLDLSMFKNVSICEDNFVRLEDDFIFCGIESIGEYKIEDLVEWNLELSETAIKQISL